MQLINDYKFDPYQVMEIVKLGIRSAFKKDYLPNEKKVQLQVNIEKDGTIRIFREYEVVEVVEEPGIQMLLADAQKIRKDIKSGETVLMDITPETLEFSRIAVQAAAQTIKQNLKTIERERFYEKFQNKQGELLRAKVLRVNGDSIVLDIEGTTVVLGTEGQIPGRIYNPGEEIFVLLREISKGLGGITLTITQSSNDFIEAILRKIVPELEEEKVVIKRIVRIPGKRSKLLVAAIDDKVDPV
jgi:transcription termination/antitermination protein NusA